MYKLSVVMILIFLSNVTINSQTYSPQAEALYELFSGENCEFNCILGVQPNVTTHQEFTTWLESQQLAYESPSHAPEEIYWATPPSIFLPYTRLSAFILNGHIREISGAINVPVDVILEVFGAPPSMTFDLSETQNADQALITYLLYPEYGLGFKLGRASFPHVHTTSFVLTAPDSPYGWVADPLGKPMTDACITYDVWPCIAPTATPTQIPLPTEGQVLYDLFSVDDSCSNPCFWGIEPGVTTFTEVILRLEAESIEYTLIAKDGMTGESKE